MIKIRNPLHAHFGHIRSILIGRQFRIGLSVILGLFLLINVITWSTYRNRVFPRSSLANQNIGNRTYNDVSKLQPIPKKVMFSTGYAEQNVTSDQLGATFDWTKTKDVINTSKPWLPIAGFFGRRDYKVQIKYDQTKLDKVIAELVKEFNRKSSDWTIDTSSDQVKLVPGEAGYSVDQAALKKEFYTGFGKGSVRVPTRKQEPKVSDKQLKPLVDQLHAKQQVSLSYSYNGTTRQPDAKEILHWYTINGTSLTLDKTKVSSFISGLGSGLGIRIQNLTELTNSTVSSLDKQTKLAATITAAPKAVKQYTYCIRAKNVGESELPGFTTKVHATLNDARGWSLDGQVAFNKVDSGCSMIIWLSAAADIPGFGAICDSTWSCAVRPNVIINHDRWTGASEAWNASGGSLDDYRSMVINHESGHYLGFGHRYCGGAGQLAPVMQQQSISLQGCSFSPWPSVAEKNTLKAQLGI